MSTHNICLYKEVARKYTCCNLKTTELLDCALMGICAVIKSNTVCQICCKNPEFVKWTLPSVTLVMSTVANKGVSQN